MMKIILILLTFLCFVQFKMIQKLGRRLNRLEEYLEKGVEVAVKLHIKKIKESSDN